MGRFFRLFEDNFVRKKRKIYLKIPKISDCQIDGDFTCISLVVMVLSFLQDLQHPSGLLTMHMDNIDCGQGTWVEGSQSLSGYGKEGLQSALCRESVGVERVSIALYIGDEEFLQSSMGKRQRL